MLLGWNIYQPEHIIAQCYYYICAYAYITHRLWETYSISPRLNACWCTHLAHHVPPPVAVLGDQHTEQVRIFNFLISQPMCTCLPSINPTSAIHWLLQCILEFSTRYGDRMLKWQLSQHDAVKAHICIDIVVKFTDEQFRTINQSTAGCFYPRVFVNCLQVVKCCERRLFIIWLQSGDFTNAWVNKVNTVIGYGTKTEVTLVEGVIG